MKDTNRHTNRKLYPIEDAISHVLFNSAVHTFFYDLPFTTSVLQTWWFTILVLLVNSY